MRRLSIWRKTVSPPGNEPPWTELTYTLVVSNTGSGLATGVIVTDTVPANTTYVGTSLTINGSGGFTDLADGDIATVSDGLITIDLGALAPGESKTIGFRVIIN